MVIPVMTAVRLFQKFAMDRLCFGDSIRLALLVMDWCMLGYV